MYVVIGTKRYNRISELRFDPEADVTGNTVPINDLWVSIKTDDSIALSSRIELRDDMDNLWAKYWVTYSEMEDKFTVRVHGESAVSRLDTVTLEPIMYQSEPVGDALSSVLSALGDEYSLDQSFNQKTLSGYCPRQSARIRLQWICLCIGGYVKTAFNDHLEIIPIEDSTNVIIPLDKTYWKPTITYKNYITAVRVAYYSYSAGEPTRTDQYVEADGQTYIEVKQWATLLNNNVPEGANENVVEFDRVTLVNQNNVSEILSFLADRHFNHTEASLSVIDNAEFIPGQRVFFFADENTMGAGYINHCSFRFGLQAKADIDMTPIEGVESDVLVITYKWGTFQVGVRVFRLPIGYDYDIQNPYLDVTFQGHRYIFRPTAASVSGTMVEGGVSVVQQVETALEQYAGHLYVRSVDGVTQEENAVSNQGTIKYGDVVIDG